MCWGAVLTAAERGVIPELHQVQARALRGQVRAAAADQRDAEAGVGEEPDGSAQVVGWQFGRHRGHLGGKASLNRSGRLPSSALSRTKARTRAFRTTAAPRPAPRGSRGNPGSRTAARWALTPARPARAAIGLDPGARVGGIPSASMPVAMLPVPFPRRPGEKVEQWSPSPSLWVRRPVPSGDSYVASRCPAEVARRRDAAGRPPLSQEVRHHLFTPPLQRCNRGGAPWHGGGGCSVGDRGESCRTAGRRTRPSAPAGLFVCARPGSRRWRPARRPTVPPLGPSPSALRARTIRTARRTRPTGPIGYLGRRSRRGRRDGRLGELPCPGPIDTRRGADLCPTAQSRSPVCTHSRPCGPDQTRTRPPHGPRSR